MATSSAVPALGRGTDARRRHRRARPARSRERHHRRARLVAPMITTRRSAGVRVERCRRPAGVRGGQPGNRIEHQPREIDVVGGVGGREQHGDAGPRDDVGQLGALEPRVDRARAAPRRARRRRRARCIRGSWAGTPRRGRRGDDTVGEQGPRQRPRRSSNSAKLSVAVRVGHRRLVSAEVRPDAQQPDQRRTVGVSRSRSSPSFHLDVRHDAASPPRLSNQTVV